MDLPLYQSVVLPRILEQVVNCKDELAQPYLMDAVIQARFAFPARISVRSARRARRSIRSKLTDGSLPSPAPRLQVFPDEFHLHTLETILGVCPQLQPNVKVGGVLAGLMSRLAKCAADTPEVRAGPGRPLALHPASPSRSSSAFCPKRRHA